MSRGGVSWRGGVTSPLQPAPPEPSARPAPLAPPQRPIFLLFSSGSSSEELSEEAWSTFFGSTSSFLSPFLLVVLGWELTLVSSGLSARRRFLEFEEDIDFLPFWFILEGVGVLSVCAWLLLLREEELVEELLTREVVDSLDREVLLLVVLEALKIWADRLLFARDLLVPLKLDLVFAIFEMAN